jgi:hypothetical protein
LPKTIFIFTKGTLELDAYEIIVGTSLRFNFSGSSDKYQVSYHTDDMGDYCLGLPK